MTNQPWPQDYEPGVPAGLELEPGAFHALLHAAAAGAPGWPAVTAFNRTVGFSELDALTGRVAAALLRDGVKPGDHVMIALADGLPFVAGALGAMRVGAVVVTMDPETPHHEMADAVRRWQPVVVLAANGAASGPVGGSVRPVIVRTVDQLPLFLRIIYRVGSPRAWRAGARTPDGAIRWADWLEKRAPEEEVEVAADQPALAASGTGDDTCTFTHAHLVAGAQQLRAWLTDAMPGDDTWLVLASLREPYGLVAGLGAAVLLRARLVLVPGGSSGDVLDALRYLRPSYVAADAATIESLVTDPTLSRPDFHTVRACLVAGPLHPDTAQQFEQATGVAPCQGYSAPRSAGLVTCNPVNGQRHPNSIGRPMPGVAVRLVDENGHRVDEGEDGLLELRGPNVACTNRWQATGVRARLDASGHVFLLGDDGHRTRPAELRGGST